MCYNDGAKTFGGVIMKKEIPTVLNSSQQRRVNYIKALIWNQYEQKGKECSSNQVDQVYERLQQDGLFFGNQDVLHKAQLEEYTGVGSQLLIRTSWDVIDPIVYAASTTESVGKQMQYEIGARLHHVFHK